jgi:hypothetical protein
LSMTRRVALSVCSVWLFFAVVCVRFMISMSPGLRPGVRAVAVRDLFQAVHE